MHATPVESHAALSLPSGAGAAEAEAACLRLRAALQAALAAPAADAAGLCDAGWTLLQQLPADVPAALRLDLLMLLAQVRYHAARGPAALEPMRAALALAAQLGDAARLRRAFTFMGVIEMDGGNLPAATECLLTALGHAARLPDPGEAASVWNNLGLALQRSALYREALQCYARAAELSRASASFGMVYRVALSNLAGCALYVEEVGPGLAAAREAIALNPDPQDVGARMSRAIAESNLCRLLLSCGEGEAASAHARATVAYAEASGSRRGALLVALVRGLLAVHRGAADEGLSQLKQALAIARREVPAEVRDVLNACVDGYRRAGQHDVALIYLHELLALNTQAMPEQVALLQRRHLRDLEQSMHQAGGVAVRSSHAGLHRQRARLSTALAERELLHNRVALLEAQSVAAELHDDATGEHCYRVGRLSAILGAEIGLEAHVCFLLDLAARLHDIGKLVVPDAILLKPGRLTDGERRIMQAHTTAGADILARSEVPQMHIAEEIARHHHERWDGGGYPLGLARERIPISARVAALADVFDALTHARPYKRAWPVDEALAEIRRLRGLQFDPALTDVFLALVPRLQREVGDLDAFLASEARQSPFVTARRGLAAALKGSDVAPAMVARRD